MSTETSVLVLAGGSGRRMAHLGESSPKGMLRVRGRPILHYLDAALRESGLAKRTLVVNPHFDYKFSSPVQFVPDMSQGDMLASLHYGLQYVGSDVLVVYSDLIFEPRLIAMLAEQSATGGISVLVDLAWQDYYRSRFGPNLGDFESLCMVNDRITEIGGQRPSTEVQGQYIGAFRICPDAMNFAHSLLTRLFDYRDHQVGRLGRTFESGHCTDFLQEAIDQGVDVKALSVSGGWAEIDHPEDLQLFEDAETAADLPLDFNIVESNARRWESIIDREAKGWTANRAS